MLRQFFGFARAQHLVLVDPTRGLTAKESNGYRGRTLTLDQQRDLLRRWTCDDEVHPHEALLGMLALLHGGLSEIAVIPTIGAVAAAVVAVAKTFADAEADSQVIEQATTIPIPGPAAPPNLPTSADASPADTDAPTCFAADDGQNAGPEVAA